MISQGELTDLVNNVKAFNIGSNSERVQKINFIIICNIINMLGVELPPKESIHKVLNYYRPDEMKVE